MENLFLTIINVSMYASVFALVIVFASIFFKNINFMGSILCTEGCISYSDEQNEEVCRYEDSRIMPLISLY